VSQTDAGQAVEPHVDEPADDGQPARYFAGSRIGGDLRAHRQTGRRLEPGLRTADGAANFARHLLTKSAERLRRGDYYCRRLKLDAEKRTQARITCPELSSVRSRTEHDLPDNERRTPLVLSSAQTQTHDSLPVVEMPKLGRSFVRDAAPFECV
jgi:hypothetical protein